MEEKERTCIICGKRELMTSNICSSCQDRIQIEAMDNEQESSAEESRQHDSELYYIKTK